MPSSNKDETPKDFSSATTHPKYPLTPMLLSKLGVKDTIILVATIPAIPKKKTKTSKLNNTLSIAGSIISMEVLTNQHKAFWESTHLHLQFIGASATIFAIPVAFVEKSYNSAQIPPGNINHAKPVKTPAVPLPLMKHVVVCAATPASMITGQDKRKVDCFEEKITCKRIHVVCYKK